MIELILSNIFILAGIALLSAIVLYFVSQKFAVVEDPRINEVEAQLPGVNCGACGKAGCHDFANACVRADEMDFTGLYCPVGGKDVMDKVANILGFSAKDKEKSIAVLKCQGTCENAPDKVAFSGLKSCRLAAKVSVGKSGCPNGCLRFGDCGKVCKFDALHIDPVKGIPVIDPEKCTSCRACVNICPRALFELRPKSFDNSLVYVACSNKQKGAVARKNCKAACIACMKCTKINDRVHVENNLSYIPSDVDVYKYGAELKKSCPTGAIVYTGENKNV